MVIETHKTRYYETWREVYTVIDRLMLQSWTMLHLYTFKLYLFFGNRERQFEKYLEGWNKQTKLTITRNRNRREIMTDRTWEDLFVMCENKNTRYEGGKILHTAG